MNHSATGVSGESTFLVRLPTIFGGHNERAVRQTCACVCVDGRCVERCQEGYFVDVESQECEACHRACKTCGGPRFDDCDSCQDELVLKDGECMKGTQLGACPVGRFRNGRTTRRSYLLVIVVPRFPSAPAIFLFCVVNKKMVTLGLCRTMSNAAELHRILAQGPGFWHKFSQVVESWLLLLWPFKI